VTKALPADAVSLRGGLRRLRRRAVYAFGVAAVSAEAALVPTALTAFTVK
jgi:hypothetical protein